MLLSPCGWASASHKTNHMRVKGSLEHPSSCNNRGDTTPCWRGGSHKERGTLRELRFPRAPIQPETSDAWTRKVSSSNPWNRTSNKVGWLRTVLLCCPTIGVNSLPFPTHPDWDHKLHAYARTWLQRRTLQVAGPTPLWGGWMLRWIKGAQWLLSPGTGWRLHVSSLWEFRAGWWAQRRLWRKGIAVILNPQPHGGMRKPAWVEANL